MKQSCKGSHICVYLSNLHQFVNKRCYEKADPNKNKNNALSMYFTFGEDIRE